MAHDQPAAHQDFQVLLCRAAFQVCTGAERYSFPDACSCWTPWCSSLPIFPACRGLSEWQNSPLLLATPTSLISVNLLRVHSVLSSKSLVIKLSKTSTNPGNTTIYRPPTRLSASDHNTLSAVFLPILNLPCLCSLNSHFLSLSMRILWEIVSDMLDANNSCLTGLGVAIGHHTDISE